MPLLTSAQIATLMADAELAALVAVDPPALEEDAQRWVVGSSLGYWFVLGSGQAGVYTYAWYLDEVTEAARLGEGRAIIFITPPGTSGGAEGAHTIILEVMDTASPRQNRRSYATHEFIVEGETIYLPVIAR